VASYRETVLTGFKEFEDNLFIKYITAFLHISSNDLFL